MPNFTSSTLWVSHSSIHDFLLCPRAYYLRNVYKDPKTGHKIQTTCPSLALGSAVHEVIESLSVIPKDSRFLEPLSIKFERAWKKVTGKKGGFVDEDTEHRYKERGLAMIKRVMDHPGPVSKPAVKISQDLPSFWLSEADEIRLCGKIDWLEYNPDTDSVSIIDFKTSTKAEDPNSLQLPIYHLLVHYCQRRPVTSAFYWYLEMSDNLEEHPLPDLIESQEKILSIAKQMKLARKLERFKCPGGDGGCYCCRPMEAILRGEAEFVGVGQYNKDMYILKDHAMQDDQESVIL